MTPGCAQPCSPAFKGPAAPSFPHSWTPQQRFVQGSAVAPGMIPTWCPAARSQRAAGTAPCRGLGVSPVAATAVRDLAAARLHRATSDETSAPRSVPGRAWQKVSSLQLCRVHTPKLLRWCGHAEAADSRAYIRGSSSVASSVACSIYLCIY